MTDSEEALKPAEEAVTNEKAEQSEEVWSKETPSHENDEKASLHIESSHASSKGNLSDPGPSDILFGRGKPYQGHSGNKRLREIVDQYKAAYVAARRYDKLAIAEEIVKGVQGGRWGTPGRFIRRVDEDGEDSWVEVADAVAREKVSHALRGKRRQSPQEHSSESSRTIHRGSLTMLDQYLLAQRQQSTISASQSIQNNSLDFFPMLQQNRLAQQHQFQIRTGMPIPIFHPASVQVPAGSGLSGAIHAAVQAPAASAHSNQVNPANSLFLRSQSGAAVNDANLRSLTGGLHQSLLPPGSSFFEGNAGASPPTRNLLLPHRSSLLQQQEALTRRHTQDQILARLLQGRSGGLENGLVMDPSRTGTARSAVDTSVGEGNQDENNV